MLVTRCLSGFVRVVRVYVFEMVVGQSTVALLSERKDLICEQIAHHMEVGSVLTRQISSVVWCSSTFRCPQCPDIWLADLRWRFVRY